MFNEWINSFGSIHIWLPYIIRFGIIAFIALVALLPASAVTAVILNATKVPIEKFLEYLSGISRSSIDKIAFIRTNISKALEDFVESNSIKYVFGIEAAKIQIAEVQDAIDNVSKKGREFPGVLESRLLNKEDPYAEMSQNIESIKGIKIDPVNVDVPDNYELLEEDYIKKRKGMTIILIFSLIAVFAMIANTALLAQFWGEMGLEDIRLFKILGYKIELSHGIAFMLTIVEIGFGAALAIHAREKSSNSLLVYGIYMSFIAFCLVELFVYFLLANEFFGDLEVLEFLPEGAHGFLLAPIGPIFVTALYVFGHFLSNAFYDVRDVNSMEKFKDDLLDAKTLSTTADNAAKNFNDTMTEYLKNIKEAFSITKTVKEDKIELPESKYLKELNEVVSKVEKTVENIKKNASKEPTSISQNLNSDEVKRYFYTMIFKFIIAIIGLLAFVFLHVPLLQKSIGLNLSYMAYNIFGVLEFLSVIIVGYIWSYQVTVQIENKSSDEVIIDGKSKIIKGALLAYIIFIFGTIIYTTLIFPVDLNITASVVLIGCIIIAFIIGQTLRIMLHSVFTLVKILFYLMQIICIWALQIISQILYLIINGFRNMMEIFSYPSLVLYKLIFK